MTFFEETSTLLKLNDLNSISLVACKMLPIVNGEKSGRNLEGGGRVSGGRGQYWISLKVSSNTNDYLKTYKLNTSFNSVTQRILADII